MCWWQPLALHKKAPPDRPGRASVSVQADQDLATLAGLAGHALELRDPARGFSWRAVHQLRQSAVVDGLAGEAVNTVSVKSIAS